VERLQVLGYPFDTISSSELLSTVQNKISQQEQFHLTFANPEHILYYNSHPIIQRYINTSAYNLADGIGAVWASKILHKYNHNKILTERITGTQFSYDIAQLCAKNNWKLFIYGGTADVNIQARNNLIQLYPDLQVSGISGWDVTEDQVITAINSYQPQVLMVCLYNGMQEPWIERNHALLPHTYLAFGNGGAVDFLAGKVKRAPTWMHRFGNYGLEWVWRLSQDLTWKRIGKTFQIPYFMALVIWYRITH
jgi:N-acetylglucosaminyldiphosphoundecaprenol N-acetyl-beta-D-mannosaminyltransferase